jgi:Putative prokaryotic signal transducing protein
MRRLLSAPNLALATLWADMLTHAGYAANVQRAFASGIAGELPPDQALPEVWVMDDAQLEPARRLLTQLRTPPSRVWACTGCSEVIEGPFEQCWNCGASMPPDLYGTGSAS